ncbi:MAG: hypothetical protein ABIZ70_07935 [Gemmatimonadales bacterium]
MSHLQIPRRPLTSPSLRIQLVTPTAAGRHHHSNRDLRGPRNFGAVLLATVIAGLFITICEWCAYNWWFRSAWQAAFAAVDGAPRGMVTFALANIFIGLFAMLLFRWMSERAETVWRAMVVSGFITAFIFWVTPTIAIAVMGLLPTPLLAVAPVLGLVAGGGGTVLGAWLYGRLTGEGKVTPVSASAGIPAWHSPR